MPGNELKEFCDQQGRQVINGIEPVVGEPSKTVIRSLDELYQQNTKDKLAAMEDFYGWAPEIQVLTENDMKKLERQEER